mmetsp:Transcript_19095/g.29552  ORF Transcript_19095/g.29552 Transcript_19095/m.29552 type:complete len:581 (-) Transcript_19095:863-2605(-)
MPSISTVFALCLLIALNASVDSAFISPSLYHRSYIPMVSMSPTKLNIISSKDLTDKVASSAPLDDDDGKRKVHPEFPKIRPLSEQVGARPFPLPMIVGVPLIKRALVLAAISPFHIGGLVISGSRGTGKSALARALRSLFPSHIEVIKGSKYNVDPQLRYGIDDMLREEIFGDNTTYFPSGELAIELVPTPYVEVPLNAMEDSLIGSVDLEESIKAGRTIFSPGILAKAHRGILYVDEINLLDEEAANILLNVMNRGYVHVEREGISFNYPCQPLMIATFNPDEGELRRHILDRIGVSLCVDLEPLSVMERVQAVENVLGFSGGTAKQSTLGGEEKLRSAEIEEDELRAKIVEARTILRKVKITREQMAYLCQEATRADCEGQRGEIFAVEVAKSSAAFSGRTKVNADDLRLAVQLTIAPRGRYMLESADEKSPADELTPSQPSPPEKQLPPQSKKEKPEQSESEDALAKDEDEETTDDERDQPKEEEIDEEQKPVPDQHLEPADIPSVFMFGVDAIPIDPSLLKFSKWTKRGVGGKRSRIFSLERGRFIKAILPHANGGKVLLHLCRPFSVLFSRYQMN